MSNVLATVLAYDFSWDPEIRAILVVALSVVVLPGSIYLILGTNLGSRLGFLVAMAGLSGWMVILGIIWTVYGIGYVGRSPTWVPIEAVVSDERDQLDAALTEAAHDLSGWNELAADDPSRGEAQAAAGAAIAGDDAPLAKFESESEYVILDAFDKGGKGDSFLEGILPGPHPSHFAIVQVQKAKEVDVEFGVAPPPPEADPSEPIVSVILERDLGNKRLPPALLTLGSLIVFVVTCNVLHRRDKAVMAARAAASS